MNLEDIIKDQLNVIIDDFKEEDLPLVKRTLQRIGEESSRLLIPAEHESAKENLGHLIGTMQNITLKNSIKGVIAARNFAQSMITALTNMALAAI